jgi:diacylglycerol O-acyltransferase
MASAQMSVQDALWLTMDRSNNLMVIDGVMVLAGVPDFEDVRATFEDAVVRFPVLARRPVQHGSKWFWEDVDDFSIDDHLSHVTLGPAADLAALEDVAAMQRSVPIDKERPLWTGFLVEPVAMADGSVGSAIITRFHHAIADGVRLTQVLIGMCEPADGTFVPPVARRGAGGDPFDPRRSVVDGAAEAVRFSVAATKAAADSVGNLAAASARAAMDGSALSAIAHLPRAGRDGVVAGINVVRHPDRLIDALENLGFSDHRSVNDLTSVTKLLLTDSGETVWNGHPGQAKAMAWSPRMSLDEVKRTARESGTTLNDVLLAAVAGGLRRYLAARDEALNEVVWMVPVNLKPFEEDLPEDLGNYFALVMLAMPLHHESRAELLQEIHHRMLRIKHSDEAVVTFGLQRSLSISPPTVAGFLTNFFANKAVGILTNVPGPTGSMTFAGIEVTQVIGFAPCSGDQPMTATIFTYNGSVTIGFAADDVLVDDLRGLVDLVVDEVDALNAGS